MGAQLIPTEQRPEIAQTAIARYLDGERIEDIAKAYGVHRKRLYQILLEHDVEGWKCAQVAAAIERLEDAKALIDNTNDALDIARARESAKIAQWELERVCKRVYGQSVDVTSTTTIIGDPLEAARRVIYALEQAMHALPEPIDGQAQRE